MATLLDSIRNDIGVVLGGAAQAAQSAASKATATTSDSIGAWLGSNINKGASIISSIAPSTKPSTPAPSVTSLTGTVSTNKNLILGAIAAVLVLFLVLKK